jgi:hypothetical protein
MPKIPLYDQQQLASEAVGTPGVDTSGAALAKGIGNAAAGVTEDILALRVQHNAEVKAAKAKQDAIDKAMQEAQDATTINRYQMESQARYEAYQAEAQTKHGFDTTGHIQGLDARMQSDMDDTLNELPEGELKLKIQKALQTEKGSALTKARTWEQSRTIPIMDANVNATAGAFANVMADSSKPLTEVFDLATDYTTKNLSNYETLYGPNAKNKMLQDVQVGVGKRLADIANRGEVDRLKTEIKKFSELGLVDPDKGRFFLNQQEQLAAMVAKDIKTEKTIQTVSRAIAHTTTAVQTPPEDIKQLHQNLTDFDSRINEIKAMPPAQQAENKLELDALITARNTTQSKITAFGKAHDQEVIKKSKAQFDSDPAVTTRKRLITARSRIQAGITSKTMNKEQAVTELEAYRKNIEKARGYGYLDDMPHETTQYMEETKWIETQLQKVSTGKDRRSLKLSDVVDFIGGAVQHFQGKPNLPGKNEAQSLDIRTRSYKENYNKLKERAEALNEKNGKGALTQPQLNALDALARQAAEKDAHGSR